MDFALDILPTLSARDMLPPVTLPALDMFFLFGLSISSELWPLQAHPTRPGSRTDTIYLNI
jgi:hypothetical protein